MKRNFFMMAFVSLFTVVALCSCGKDEEENDDKDGNGNGVIQNNTITAVIENGANYSAKIETVKAVIYGYYPTEQIASTPYINGGFILILPASPDIKYFYNIVDEYLDLDSYEGITVSNHNVKGCDMYLSAYKSDYPTGYIYHGTEDWVGDLIYVDEDLSITGSHTETDDYDDTYTLKVNLHLKKGWNMVYGKNTETETDILVDYAEYTTQAPEGAKWYFHDSSLPSTSGSLRKQVSPLSAKHKHRFLSESGFSGLKD